MRARFQREREAWVEYLNKRHITHLVTLATNQSFISPARMRGLLKEWDARVNRALYGSKWHKQSG